MSHLGGFSEEALQLFQLAASEQSYEFSEEGETYDFTRCMRPDGSFYGTGGSCRKGSQAEAKKAAATGGVRNSTVAESRKAMKHQREQMNLHGNKIAELQAAGKKIPKALKAKYDLARASYNSHRKAVNDATGVMKSPVMQAAREAGRAEEAKNREKRAIQRGEERIARATKKPEGQLKGAGEALKTKAESRNKAAIQNEFAKAAKDARSRIDDLKSELKRGDADKSFINSEIKRWERKAKDLEKRAEG
jgi:chromosome segregation ATPase